MTCAQEPFRGRVHCRILCCFEGIRSQHRPRRSNGWALNRNHDVGLQHIRSYGFLANRYRESKLALCRELLSTPTPVCAASAEQLDYRDRYKMLTGVSLRECPVCGRGAHAFPTLPDRTPPDARVPPPATDGFMSCSWFQFPSFPIVRDWPCVDNGYTPP